MTAKSYNYHCWIFIQNKQTFSSCLKVTSNHEINQYLLKMKHPGALYSSLPLRLGISVPVTESLGLKSEISVFLCPQPFLSMTCLCPLVATCASHRNSMLAALSQGSPHTVPKLSRHTNTSFWCSTQILSPAIPNMHLKFSKT